MCLFEYPSSYRGYKCYDIASSKIIIFRDVIFDESSFPFTNRSQHNPQEHDFLDTPHLISQIQSNTSHTSPNPEPSIDTSSPPALPLIGPSPVPSPLHTQSTPLSPLPSFTPTGLDHPTEAQIEAPPTSTGPASRSPAS